MLEPEEPDPAAVEPVEPEPAAPVVPEPVVPAVEPLVVDPDDLIAFARMKLPERELDAADPAVDAVEPLVPAVLLPLESCRQPVTVTVLALPLPVALPLCVPLCGAAPTIQPAPIASANAVHVCLFMRNSLRGTTLQSAHHFYGCVIVDFSRQYAGSHCEHLNQPRYKSLRHATAPQTCGAAHASAMCSPQLLKVLDRIVFFLVVKVVVVRIVVDRVGEIVFQAAATVRLLRVVGIALLVRHVSS